MILDPILFQHRFFVRKSFASNLRAAGGDSLHERDYTTLLDPRGSFSSSHTGKIFETGKIGQAVQSEVNQKLIRRPVKDRLAHHFFPPQGSDDPPLEKGLEDADWVGASEGLNFWAGHWLTIGDDGQGLERGPREANPVALPVEASNPRVMFRPGLHPEPSRDPDNSQTPGNTRILQDQLCQCVTHRCPGFLRENG